MCTSIIGNGAIDAENLRPDTDNSGSVILRPVGLPSSTTMPDGYNAIARIGNRLIVTKGNKVGSIAVNSGGNPDISTNELPGSALCAITRDTSAIVMTTAGAVSVGADGTVDRLCRDYPAISLLAVADADVSASVGDRTLSKAYSNGLFDKKDSDALVGDLAGAYRHLCSEAASSGVMIQPALARYKLFDSKGNMLFESPPVLLTHAEGAQCTDTVALSSSDRQTIDGYTLTAKTWHLEAVLPEAEGDVARAELFMTPLFHPYDTDSDGSATLLRAGVAGAPFCRVGLPGRENGLGNTYRGKSRRTIMQAIARIEMLEERVAVIINPFGNGARRIKVDIAVEPDPGLATARIKKAFTKRVAVRDHNNVILSAPHGFSAACAAESSGAVVWGNISALPYSGYPVGIFAAEVSDGVWRCHSAVYFEGNKGVERQERGETNAPSKLGPVICYPLPEARTMSIISYFDGQNHLATLDLSADASGRYAVYIAPDLKPFTPAASASTVVVTVTDQSIKMPDSLAFADSSRPLDIKTIISTGSEAVALKGLRSGNQAWEFGRSHFTLGCRSGIYGIGVNINSGATGLRTLSQHGIDREDAIASGKDGDIFIARGNITRITRSGKAEIIADNQDYIAVAYDSERDELTALRRGGNIDIYSPAESGNYFRYTRITAEALKLFGNVFAVKGNMLYDLSTEIFSASNRINLHLRKNIRPDYRMADVAWLNVAMQTSQFDGSITINASGPGRLRPWLIRKAAVSGAIAGPVAIKLPCRAARAVELLIEGDVADDFVFDSAWIKLV